MSRIPSQPMIRLDHAIEEVVANTPDAAIAPDLVAFHKTLSVRQHAPEGIEPPTLTDALFLHLMPHLKSAGILRSDQRKTLLTCLEARAQSSFGPVVPGGLEALSFELHNLELLMRYRDSLIGG